MNIELLSHWGDDLTVVNNARVSFDKESEWEWKTSDVGYGFNYPDLKSDDKRLISYLARGVTKKSYDDMILELQATGEAEDIITIVNHWRKTPTHWAPFANGVGMRFRVKAPIPIMRQLFKTKVGSVESEVSRRYVSSSPEVFYPTWRQAAENVKQGSGAVFDEDTQQHIWHTYESGVSAAVVAYEDLLSMGVCPEQARFVLPQGVQTEAIISNSLYGWANVFNQRSDYSHAQHEIADLVWQLAEEAKTIFPVSWEALTK